MISLSGMFSPTVGWLELALRAIIVYAFLIVLLRLTGKRQVGQMSPFDLVLLLVLSNAVQNAMNGGDNSVTAGFIIALTLFIINTLVAWVTFRSKRLERLVEGEPVVLIHNGKIFEDVLDREHLSHHELSSALRQAGCSTPAEVHVAILENNGHVSVLRRDSNPSAPTPNSPPRIPG